jgi:hypothetical protein
MHAVAALFITLANKPDLGEPYFEDQPVAELGFGFKSIVRVLTIFTIQSTDLKRQVNSGIPEAWLSDPNVPTLLLGYFVRRHWPSYLDVSSRDRGTPILTNPGPLEYNDYFPVPVSFYQDVQQEGFWAVLVRQFGNSVFQYRAVKEGSRLNYRVTDAAKGEYNSSYIAMFTEQDDLKMLIGPFKSKVEGLQCCE